MVGQDIEYVFKMRYLFNTLRVWLPAKTCWEVGYRPSIEAPIPKDWWITPTAEAFSAPPVPRQQEDEAVHEIFTGVTAMSRSPNPKLPGGSMALVDINNNKLLRPLDRLGRTRASCQRQVAFNRRVLQKNKKYPTSTRNCPIFCRAWIWKSPLLCPSIQVTHLRTRSPFADNSGLMMAEE
jgi:hypothetical protein